MTGHITRMIVGLFIDPCPHAFPTHSPPTHLHAQGQVWEPEGEFRGHLGIQGGAQKPEGA